jgi:hypothetical protein
LYQLGFKGWSEPVIKGSLLIEIILQTFFIIPGLIYSIWRLASKYSAWPKYLAPNIIPLDSPVAQKILSTNGI